MVRQLQSNLCVDSNRIYASGKSNVGHIPSYISTFTHSNRYRVAASRTYLHAHRRQRVCLLHSLLYQQRCIPVQTHRIVLLDVQCLSLTFMAWRTRSSRSTGRVLIKKIGWSVSALFPICAIRISLLYRRYAEHCSLPWCMGLSQRLWSIKYIVGSNIIELAPAFEFLIGRKAFGQVGSQCHCVTPTRRHDSEKICLFLLEWSCRRERIFCQGSWSFVAVYGRTWWGSYQFQRDYRQHYTVLRDPYSELVCDISGIADLASRIYILRFDNEFYNKY